jgi:hypothetical protein
MARILVAVSLMAIALGAFANDDLDALIKAEIAEIEGMKAECGARANQASPEALVRIEEAVLAYGDHDPIVQKWAAVFESCRQERIAKWKANAARLRADAQRLKPENQTAYQ